MEGVHLNIRCTRVYIKKYATYLSSCMVPDIIALVAKNKKLDMRMNIYSMFKRTTKIDAPLLHLICKCHYLGFKQMNALPMNSNLQNPLYVEFDMYSIS